MAVKSTSVFCLVSFLLVAAGPLPAQSPHRPEGDAVGELLKRLSEVQKEEAKLRRNLSRLKKQLQSVGQEKTSLVDEEEEQAVQVVTRLGGKVIRDEAAPGKPVVSVDLNHTNAADADLKLLPTMKHLQSLDLSWTTDITDVGMKEVAQLKHLQSLSLMRTAVTDAGMKEVARLKHLQLLDLCNTKVTDAGLKDLDVLRRMRDLDITNTQVTNASVTTLAMLKNLRLLHASSRNLTDAGREELKRTFPNLSFVIMSVPSEPPQLPSSDSTAESVPTKNGVQ